MARLPRTQLWCVPDLSVLVKVRHAQANPAELAAAASHTEPATGDRGRRHGSAHRLRCPTALPRKREKSGVPDGVYRRSRLWHVCRFRQGTAAGPPHACARPVCWLAVLLLRSFVCSAAHGSLPTADTRARQCACAHVIVYVFVCAAAPTQMRARVWPECSCTWQKSSGDPCRRTTAEADVPRPQAPRAATRQPAPTPCAGAAITAQPSGQVE